MKYLKLLEQNLLSILSIIAFFWWVTAGSNTAPLAFYSFAVIYGGYYVDWARRNPTVPLKKAKHRVQFDAVIVVLMIGAIITGGSGVLAIAGGIIFVLGTVGADIFLYRRAKRNAKTEDNH
jgi:hypothetical protein